MNDAWATLILAVATAIPGFVAALMAYIQSRRNTRKADELHVIVNSRLDQLVQLNRNQALLEGAAQERSEERTRSERRPME